MQRCCGCMKEFGKEYDVCPNCGYIVGTAPKMKNHLFGGTVLAERYMLGKVLGYGGFGITYIAWDKKLNRAVAIKEFFPNSLSTRSEGETLVSCYDDKASKFFQDGVKKMLDEGNRLSKFSNNENIVNVHDCFEENNTAYIVMEYLEGKDLKKYLEENGGKLAPEKAVEIILPIINALEDMHKENLIHRDISPDNIFLCENGKIKLLDFGSARLAVEDSDKSLSVMVKRGYAPKEQYASRSKQGPWTDVYAVSATLYKMITGILPVESTERDEEALKRFKELGISGNDELEGVITKGLEVEYTNRTKTVSELKRKLVEATRPKSAEEKATPKPFRKTEKEKKINFKAIIAAVLAVAAVVGAVLAVKFIPDKKTEAAETTTAVTQSVNLKASQELVVKAMKAYEEELAGFDGYYSAYVFDLNGDGVSEVICSPEDAGMQFMMTYTEENGISVVSLTGHSAMMPEVYISEDNCLYVRDDGHNQGTAFYHYASVYKIDETGFVNIGEVEGDDPEEFDWENEAVFNEMDAKYEDLFEQKLSKLIGEKDFKAYSEVANVQNPVEYMNSELSINIYRVVETRRIYEDYLNSPEAKEYYGPFYNESLYDGNKYNGEKELMFVDIDGDGTDECLLSVPFPSESALYSEAAYIFDVDGEVVRLVHSSFDCGSHRSQQKFSLIENNGSYLIHNYYTDPHELWGSVYSYDGKNVNLVWSYDCDVTNGIPEEDYVFLVSQKHDFLESFASGEVDYLRDYYDGTELPEYISAVSSEEFYKTYGGYIDSADHRFPLLKVNYRVTNSAGTNVRAYAGADNKKIGELNSGDIVVGYESFMEYDSNDNAWIRIEYGEGFGWVALNNLTIVET